MGALAIDDAHRNALTARAIEITGLSNPNSRTQLLAWLNENTTLELEDLTKATVAANIGVDDKTAAEILNLRRELSKSSVSKYKAMATAVCRDGRVRGLLQYYGASRTGALGWKACAGAEPAAQLHRKSRYSTRPRQKT